MIDKENWVEKSKALVWAKFVDEKAKFSVGEFKLLDVYLSRINARKPSSGKVRFTRAEYCELMGLDPSLRTTQLKRYVEHFMGNSVTIHREGKWGVYPLFVSAEADYDPEVGQVVIEIECNYKIKDVFFELSKDGYARYRLKNIIALDGKYAVRLYPMLKDAPFGRVKVGVAELREYLDVRAKRYQQFKFLCSEVINKSLDEINEKTDIKASIEKIKEGRNVVAVEFIVEHKALPELPPPADPDVEPDTPEPEATPELSEPDPLELSISALPSSFTREQVQVLHNYALAHLPYEIMSFAEKYLWIADYLQEKVLLMKAAKDVKSPYKWLCRAVEENWK